MIKLLLLFVSLTAFAQTPSSDLIEKQLVLKANAEVWSKTVCLNDLVDGGWINSRCSIDRAMCCRWTMGESRTRAFTRGEIARELGHIKIFGFSLDVIGPEQVTVTQTHRELTTQEIASKYLAAATQKFGDNGSTITLESIKLLGPIYIAFEEENDWDLDLPEALTDKAPVRIISVKDSTKVLGWAQVKPRLESEVYVARKSIHPSEILKPEYFELKRIDVLAAQTAGQAIVRKGQFPDTVRARSVIMGGATLTADAVERIPMVKLGDAVTLILRSDSLRISTKGFVQGAAGVGDMVNVSLPRYNRTFRGRLVEGKLVEVWL